MMPLGSVLDCGTWFSLIEEQLYWSHINSARGSAVIDANIIEGRMEIVNVTCTHMF